MGEYVTVPQISSSVKFALIRRIKFFVAFFAFNERYTGRKGGCQAMGGGTYVHSLKNGVAFGASMPGTDNRMHGADEFAVVEELLVSAAMFAQIIVELCG